MPPPHKYEESEQVEQQRALVCAQIGERENDRRELIAFFARARSGLDHGLLREPAGGVEGPTARSYRVLDEGEAMLDY
jgi:hypothetical protein